MKLLLIGPAHPLRGGIAQFLALLYGALKKAGHNVVFHRFIRQYPKFLFPGKTQDDESKSPVEVDSIASLDPLNPFNWPLAAYRIAKEKPDVVVLKWWMPFFGPSYIVTLWLAKLFCGTKVVYIVDNAIPHEKRPGDMLITKLGFAVADGFVVMSEAVRKDLLSIKPDARFVYSPHPLYDIFGTAKDAEAAKNALGLSGPVILFFGFVRHYKGLDILLDAMPRILERLDVTLIVAGEFYEDRAAYDEKIASLGIGERVLLMDRFIANEEVAGIFSAADALVLPYRTATQSGITQIAYVFGTPVIATTVGGLPEVVKDGETGMLVTPEDPGAVADAVIRFFAEGGAARYRPAIEREKGRFSWEGMVEAIVGLAEKDVL